MEKVRVRKIDDCLLAAFALEIKVIVEILMNRRQCELIRKPLHIDEAGYDPI